MHSHISKEWFFKREVGTISWLGKRKKKSPTSKVKAMWSNTKATAHKHKRN